MTGFVYAIEVGDGLVKFGYSEHLRTRVNRIRSVCKPLSCSLVGFVEGTMEQEQELHSLLASCERRGEYYSRCALTEQVLSLFPRRELPKSHVMSSEAKALTAAIQIVGSAAALARSIGVKSQAISQWGRVPYERVLEVEAATGGRVTRHQLCPTLYPLPQGAAQ